MKQRIFTLVLLLPLMALTSCVASWKSEEAGAGHEAAKAAAARFYEDTGRWPGSGDELRQGAAAAGVDLGHGHITLTPRADDRLHVKYRSRGSMGWAEAAGPVSPPGTTAPATAPATRPG